MINNLTDRVQKMLDGETKRRETALKWVDEIENILEHVGEHLWGTGLDIDIDRNTITLTRIDKENKKKPTCIYYRYVEHETANDREWTGFYNNNESNCNMWGQSIQKLKGNDFWYAIQVIMDWIPQVTDLMDKKETSREELLTKVNL